ncbi:MAG TPA: hypothetical protein VGR37_07200 [Longimicrobiaceae bacterium]|nr:hypothetical protein [Longimicrobiaceae bacterium]
MLAVLALALLAAACQDTTTGPTARPDDAAAPLALNQSASSPFYCVTQRLTPGANRAQHLPLGFPRATLAPDGAVTRYRYRGYGKDGQLVAVADCVIPRTVPAVEEMNRRVGVPLRSGLPVGGGRPGEEVTVAGDSYCSPDPTGGCTVVGDPNPEPPGGCRVECNDEPPAPISGGGHTGGGDANDTPAGEPIADDELVDCHGATSGNCDKRPANADTVTVAKTHANKIRTDGICGEIRTMALAMLDNGLEIWSNEVRQDGVLMVGDWGWRYVNPTGIEKVPVMHLWTDPRGFNAWTIAHEALHGMGKSHGDLIVGPDGVTRNMDKTAKYCSQS